jgi:hypothetical protein
MLTANFDENVQRQMRNILAHKESKYLRGSRQRLDESMFEKIKTIGVGAFGKVVLVRKVRVVNRCHLKVYSLFPSCSKTANKNCTQ